MNQIINLIKKILISIGLVMMYPFQFVYIIINKLIISIKERTLFLKIKTKLGNFIKKEKRKLFSLRYNPNFWFIVVILILGLTPLLWYKSTSIALGHDMGFPLNPLNWFKDRLWAWSDKNNLGSDQSVLMGSVILHGFEFIIFFITKNIYFTQKFTYIVWFTLSGISMYAFIVSALRSKNKRMIGLIGGVLFMFNLFFLQGWFIAERNKFAILAALPLTLLLILKVIRDKYSITKAAIFISLIYLLLNGGGSIPLYGSTILIIPVATLIFSFSYIKNFKEGLRVIKFLILALFLFLLANSFWILPELFTVKNSFSIGVQHAGGVESNKAWIDEISKNASYINLMRMEGFPDWGPNHQYAPVYVNNIVFIAISFIFIFITIYYLLRLKNKNDKIIAASAIASLILCVIFAAGTNGFLGDLYLYLIDHVSFLIIFRTPFYKFAGGIVFAFCILFSAGIVLLAEDLYKISNKYFSQRKLSINTQALNIISRIGIIFLLIIYTFPFLTGSFFDWNKPISTMVNVPDYVFNYGNYTDNLKTPGRILMVPDITESNSLDITDWNYFSLDNVPSLISSKTHVNGSTNTPFVEDSSSIAQLLYKNLLTVGDSKFTQLLLNNFGISNILLRLDLISFRNATITNPKKWQNVLDQAKFLRKEISFNKWILYSVNSNPQIITSYNNLQIINSRINSIQDLYNSNILNKSTANVFLETPNSLNNTIDQIANDKQLNYRNIIQLRPAEGDILDGKIVFNLTGKQGDYQVIAKQFDLSELWYRLYARKKGNLDIFTVERPQTQVLINGKSVKLESKRQEFEITPTVNIDRLIINSEVFPIPLLTNDDTFIDSFQTKSNQISISYASINALVVARNVLVDPSFETGLWTGGQICGGPLLPKNVSAEKVIDRTDGNFAASLTSQDQTIGCLIQSLNNLDKTKLYKMSFDYKNISGFSLKYCILRRNLIGDKITDNGCLREGVMSKTNKWQTNNIDFLPSTDQEHILHFYSESDKNSITTNYIDNVRIYQVDAIPVGTFKLNTGIEVSQLFNIQQNYENLGSLNLQDKNNIQISTIGGFQNKKFIDNSEFEDKLWGGANFCGGDQTKSQINIDKDPDHTSLDGTNSVRVSSDSGTGCIYNPIQNFRPSLIYKFSFDYKNISGNAPEFCALVQDKNGGGCKPYAKLDKNFAWTTYSTIIQTNQDTLGVILHFYSPAKLGEKSINLFDNIKVEAVYNPLQSIYLVSNFNNVAQDKIADITSKELNPTLYDIKVTGEIKSPQIISFNKAYSPYWRMNETLTTPLAYIKDLMKNMLSILKTGKFTNELPHYHTDGINNGWIVSKDGNYTIEYLPEKFFEVGVFITITYLLTLILIKAIYKNKK